MLARQLAFVEHSRDWLSEPLGQPLRVLHSFSSLRLCHSWDDSRHSKSFVASIPSSGTPTAIRGNSGSPSCHGCAQTSQPKVQMPSPSLSLASSKSKHLATEPSRAIKSRVGWTP